MRSLTWGEEYRTVQVCVDTYEEGVLSGRFYHPMRQEGEIFRSLSQFLLKLDGLFDEMDRPQADTKIRSFGASSSPALEKPKAPWEGQGRMSTFRVRILFRQHSSWQGEIIWVERAMSQCFRSVLELVHLMDSALRKQ